jgi:hypothetical protein
MIITTEVQVKIIGKTLSYFRNLGYIVNVNESILIPIEHLNRKSRIKIEVKCDVCSQTKFLPYQKYTKSLDNYNYYSCSQKCSIGKCKNTFLSNWGVSSPMKIEQIKQKGKNTKFSRYGDENYNNFEDICKTKNERYGDKFFNNQEKIKKTIYEMWGVENSMYVDEVKEKVKKTKIERGIMLPDELLGDFQVYKRNANRITRNNKIKLFEIWDGFDYYDNEYIYKNYSLNPMDRCYPTIDHKISIYQGFINKIDYNKIGSLENLCITKKFLNSKKGFTKECFEFKDSIH